MCRRHVATCCDAAMLHPCTPDGSMFPESVGVSLPESKSKATTKVEKGGGGLAVEFEQVAMKHGVVGKSLDEWMVGVAQFVIRADILLDPA